MLLAILKDLNNDKKYNIYINKYNESFNYTVKCFEKTKNYYLDNESINNLLSNIFSYEKKYVNRYNQYDIFIDDFNNKHFIKSNYEDMQLFFKYNGINALMNTFFNKNNKDNYPKTFFLKSKNGISYVLTCSMLFLSLSYLYINLNKPINISFSEYVQSEITELYNNNFNINTLEIINKLNNSNGLSDEEKEYLINNKIFDDITNILESDRNEELRERLTNVTKVFFTEDELKSEEKIDTAGYYNCLQPNILHVRDDNVAKDVLSHEFIHLLQDSNRYHFIREAMAEILKEEYYGEKINAYHEEVKYVKILLEMINSECVFKCCFSGDTSDFEREINSKLSLSDATRLLDLLSVNPSYCDNIDEVYQEIKELLSKMNKNDIEENDLFYTVLHYPENVHKGYFNNEYIKDCADKESELVCNIPLEEAVEKGLVDIKCEAITIEEVSENEFKNLSEDLKYMEYDLKDNYYLSDIYIVSSDGKEKYTIKEAMEKGIINNLIFYKRIIIDNISLEDAIKYKNGLVENFSSHITILENSDNIKILGMPAYKNIKDKGLQPYINISYLKNINNKFKKLK